MIKPNAYIVKSKFNYNLNGQFFAVDGYCCILSF